MVSKKKNLQLCIYKDAIEKSVPCDQRLLSLGKPHDTKW